MSAPSQSASESVGVDILNATRSEVTSSVMLQTGDALSGTVESDQVESWQHAGFCSIPANPVEGQSACQGLVRRRGDIDICTNTRDTRGQAIAGNLGPGETCVYAGGRDGNSQGRLLLKGDGSITLLTTDTNIAAGKVVAFRLSPTEMRFTAPWGSFVFDASGFHLKTKAGPRFDMGGISIPGIPDALSGPLSGYINLTAPVIKNTAANVFNGAGSVFSPAIYAPVNPLPPPAPINAPLNAALAAFGAAIATAIGTLNPAAVPAAAVTAITTATAALVAAVATIPIQSQTVWNAP